MLLIGSVSVNSSTRVRRLSRLIRPAVEPLSFQHRLFQLSAVQKFVGNPRSSLTHRRQYAKDSHQRRNFFVNQSANSSPRRSRSSVLSARSRFLSGTAATAMSAAAGTAVSAESSSSSTSSDIRVVIPDKSKSDSREYRILQLANGIEVCVVSDPETDKSAAALSVKIGHFGDPDILPGLAHFCEHMLFLGTEKYPDESEYNKYLKEHGGSDNAYTAMSETCYEFDVHKDHLEGALDRFAQFFIAPLFTESATEREMKAVNSENQNNLQSDPHRLFQLDKHLAKKSHPFHKFGTGNIQTLKEDVPSGVSVRDELLKFHQNYYSPSVMKLSIIGKENLDELQSYAIKMFSSIPVNPKRMQAPKYSSDVYDIENTFPLMEKVFPIKEYRELSVAWVLPSVYEEYKSKPTSLLAYCLGDESKGSVLSRLKDLGYANSLSAGLSYNTPEFSLFRVSISLTPEGLANYNEILTIIYQYLKRMRDLSDEQWKEYFEERKKVRQMNFDFKGKENPYDYTSNLASSLHKYQPLNELLELMGGVVFDFDAQRLKDNLDLLTADRMWVRLVGKEFEDECQEIEQWYGTKFSVEKMSDELINQWKDFDALPNDDNYQSLFTPMINPYIADDFSLVCEAMKSEDEGKVDDSELLSLKRVKGEPEICHSNDHLQIYHKTDYFFKQPKMGANLRVLSPLLKYDPESAELTQLMVSCMNDLLSEHTYQFEEAALHYGLSFNGYSAINLKFSGYNQKLDLLAETVLKQIIEDFPKKLTKERFEKNLEMRQRGVQSFRKEKAFRQVTLMHSYLLDDQMYSLNEIENGLKNATYEKVLAHFHSIFGNKDESVIKNRSVQALVYGNVAKDEALSASKWRGLCEKYLTGSSSSASKSEESFTIQKYRNSLTSILKLPRMKDGEKPTDEAEEEKTGGMDYIFEFENFNGDDNNSAISNDYMFTLDQSGLDDPKQTRNFAKLRLFSQLIQAPCFDQLRTKEQLGYIVWSFGDINKGHLSFRVIVQSSVAKPDHLDNSIESFLLQFRNELVSIDSKTLDANKEGVINDLMEKTKHIGGQMNRYWGEFSNERFNFQRREILAGQVEDLTLEELVDFYDRFVLNSNGERLKVSVRCVAQKDPEPMAAPEEADVTSATAESGESSTVAGAAPTLTTSDSTIAMPFAGQKTPCVVTIKESEVNGLKKKYGFYPSPYVTADEGASSDSSTPSKL